MIVVCSKPGQLGNRLFVFATFVAFSKEYNVPMMNVSFDEYADHFPLLKEDVFSRFPLKKSKFRSSLLRRWIYYFFYYLARIAVRLKMKNSLIYSKALDWNERVDLDDAEFVELAKGTQLLLLQGWIYRCPVTFQKHSEFLRKVFTPDEKYLGNVSSLMNKVRNGAVQVIGIHIRHGDYARFEGGKYFYSLEQYAFVMRSIKSIFPGKHVRFLVCSNVTIDKAVFSDLDIVAGTGHFVEDLYSLAQCDYLAGPPSTFTIWASFYGRVPLYMIQEISQQPDLSDFVIRKG